MPLLLVIVAVLVLVVVLAALVAALRRPGPLCELSRDGDVLALRLSRPAAVLALRGRARVPVAAVTAVRAVPPGERVGLHLRLLGTGAPGLAVGLFWRRGRGRCLVVRRARREAVELELAEGGTRQWIVEVPSAAAAVRELTPAG